MNFKRFTLILSVSIAIGVLYLNSNSPIEGKYHPLENASAKFSSANGFLDYIEMVKANQHTGDIKYSDVIAGLKQANKLTKAKSNLNISWAFKGPDNIGGRTRALIIDRNDRNHILAGGVAGGVFESTDAGQTWRPYDDTYSVKNISCIAQAADGTFYVGTGGHFENNRSTRAQRGYFFAGTGLWKLTGNGGYEAVVQPTSRIELGTPWTTIGQIEADPNDPNILYAAMNRGFRKIDMSTNPATITDPIGINTTRANDVDVTADGKVIVTYNDGSIHVSHDNGQKFARIGFNGAGRIEVAVAPSNSDIMYASMGRSSNNCLFGVFRSRDGGATWQRISPGSSVNFDMMSNTVPCTANTFGQANWDNMIAVHPDDPGLVFVGGVTLYRWEQSSVDPETPNGSWNQIDIISSLFSLPGQARPSAYLHADKHRMVFDPVNTDIAYIANDGGVYKSFDITSTSPSYRAFNFNYGVTQFYDIGVSPLDLVLGGTQDNGSILTGMQYNNNLGGYNTLTGDGFDAEMSFINPSLGFAASQFNGVARIQGIAKKAGNSNISQADIVGANPFLSGICQTRCSDVFYSTSKLWESFKHEASKDVVSDIIIEQTLPPMKAGRKLEYESNNSNPDREIFFEKTVLEAPFNANLADNGRPSANYSLGPDNVWRIYPADTLFGKNEITNVVIDQSPASFVFNFDTLTIDTALKRVIVNHPNLNPDTFNYVLGTNYNYPNEYIDNEALLNGTAGFTVIERIVNGAPQTSMDVRDIQISFAYTLNYIDSTQSMFFSANWPGRSRQERNLWMSRDLMKNSPQLLWYNVAGENSEPDDIARLDDVITIEVTKDGDIAFIGTRTGRLFRLSGLNSLSDDFPFSESANLYALQEDTVFIVDDPTTPESEADTALLVLQEIASFDDRAITGIALSDYDPNYMAVSLGNYGNDDFVYVIDNAMYRLDGASDHREATKNLSIQRRRDSSTVLDINGMPKYPNTYHLPDSINAYSVQGMTNDVLPKVPAYDVEFDILDSVVPPTKLYVGNELGFYVAENPFAGPVMDDSTLVAADTSIRTRDTVPVVNTGTQTLLDSIVTAADSVVFNDSTVYRTPRSVAYIVSLNTPDTTFVLADTSIRTGFDTQWSEETVGMGRVPVFSIEQNKFDWKYSLFYSKLYVGTHGRGVYENARFVGLPEVEHNSYADGFKSSVMMYPNPTRDNTFVEFNLVKVQNVTVEVFDIRGQLVKQEMLTNLKVGNNKVQMNMSDIPNGTFIMRVRSGDAVATKKFVVHK